MSPKTLNFFIHLYLQKKIKSHENPPLQRSKTLQREKFQKKFLSNFPNLMSDQILDLFPNIQANPMQNLD